MVTQKVLEGIATRAREVGATAIQILALDDFGMIKDISELTVKDWGDDLIDGLIEFTDAQECRNLDIMARYDGEDRFETTFFRVEVRGDRHAEITYERDAHTEAMLQRSLNYGFEPNFGIGVGTA